MNCAHAFFFAEASLAFVSGHRAHSSNLLEYPAILDGVILVQYKMVVLTIVTQKKGETIFFDEPIPEVHFMKLLSCSLYNSWDTLKKESIAILRDGGGKVSKIPPGHCNLDNFKKLINGLFEAHYNKLEAQINTSEAVLQINNFGGKTITLNRDFAKILGVDVSLELITNVKRLRYPTSYFIHCDLIDRNFNFVNNKK